MVSRRPAGRRYHCPVFTAERHAMRIAVFLPLVASLGACAVVPPQAWSFDPTQPQPKATLPAEQLVPMTARLGQLQLERNEIQARIAGERHALQRQPLYEDLHRVGIQL